MLENNSPIEANISLGGQEFLTHFDLSFHIIKSLIILTIIVFSIINNVLVIISVMLFRRLRHINNYFLVSLAFADLSVAIFAMTFKATVEITGRWNFTLFMCDFWNSMDVHASTVSTLHLCCISVDRYYAIARPLQYHMVITVRVACGMMALAWLAPTAISFLPIFMGWYTTDEFLAARAAHPDECLFVVNKTYAFLSSSLTFWLPVLVMISLYYRIYKEAKRHRAAIRRHSVPMVCHPSLAIPSACSIGAVTPSSYSLNIMIGSAKLGGLAPQPNYVTCQSGRRSSSSCPRLQPHREGTRRRSLTGVSSGASSSLSPSPSPSSQGGNARLTLPHSSNNSVWSGHPGQITLTPGIRVTSAMAGPCAAERRAVRSANWRKEHKVATGRDSGTGVTTSNH